MENGPPDKTQQKQEIPQKKKIKELKPEKNNNNPNNTDLCYTLFISFTTTILLRTVRNELG